MMKVNMMIKPVLVLEDELVSSLSYEGHVSYKGWGIDFLEKDGSYAYSEFFSEFFDKESNQTILKMVDGDWYSSISELMSSSNFKNNKGAIYNKVNSPSFDFDEFQKQFNNCISKLKNGEGLTTPRCKDMIYIEY